MKRTISIHLKNILKPPFLRQKGEKGSRSPLSRFPSRTQWSHENSLSSLQSESQLGGRFPLFLSLTGELQAVWSQKCLTRKSVDVSGQIWAGSSGICWKKNVDVLPRGILNLLANLPLFLKHGYLMFHEIIKFGLSWAIIVSFKKLQSAAGQQLKNGQQLKHKFFFRMPTYIYF